jgi:hypothetical protein
MCRDTLMWHEQLLSVLWEIWPAAAQFAS